MIQITPQMRLLLAVEPVDFRKGGIVRLIVGDEDEGLRDRRQGVSDVERARDELVSDQAAQLEDRGRRCERADAQSVEEVGDGADRKHQRRGTRGDRRALFAPAQGAADPVRRIGQGQEGEGGDERLSGIEHVGPW